LRLAVVVAFLSARLARLIVVLKLPCSAVQPGIKRLFKFALKKALKGILKHELSLNQFEVRAPYRSG
jgi:hypothetical protein